MFGFGPLRYLSRNAKLSAKRFAGAISLRAALLLLLTSCSVTLLAQSPQDLWKAESPDGSYLAATRRIPDSTYIWREDLDDFRLVVFPLEPGSDHNTGKLYFSRDFAGRVPAQVQWSPSSRFLVLTTTSSGGHSPWHYTTFVVSLANRKVVSPDETYGPVVAPAIAFKSPNTVVLGIGQRTTEGIDFEHPVMIEIDLPRLFGRKK
jgi:hypothetical protein